jgi:carboxymethylenebutenolidase
MLEEDFAMETHTGSTPAYLATPDGWDAGPGVVVIQEWWGLNDQIRGVARRFAAEGFAALAPDLYQGRQATEPDEARKLSMALDEKDALDRLRAGIRLLAERGASAVGMIGFCMGGGLAWELALSDEGCDAVVPCYGGVEFRGRRLTMPFQAHYGDQDHFPEDMYREIEAHLDDTAGSALFRYPGAGHAFLNEMRPEVYREDDARIAWDRIFGFFRLQLT